MSTLLNLHGFDNCTFPRSTFNVELDTGEKCIIASENIRSLIDGLSAANVLQRVKKIEEIYISVFVDDKILS